MFLGRVDENSSQQGGVAPAIDPVPLVILELSLGGVPDGGWSDYLGRRGMPMIPDSLGRDSVSHSHARQILDEARETELRRQKVAAVVQEQVDEQHRAEAAKVWKGISALDVPVGMTLGEMFFATEHGSRPRRKNPVEAALDGDGAVYYPIEREAS